MVDGSVYPAKIVGGMSLSIETAFDRLASASLEELTKIVGPKTARSVFDYFRNKSNQKIIIKLKKAGVNLGVPKQGLK